jgi:hypothetical protein
MIENWLERGAAAVLAAAHAMPARGDLVEELEALEAAQARGYFLPDEEVLVRLRYSQYLGLRAALGETLAMLAERSGWHDEEWKGRLPFFTAAFAAACVLMRVDRFLVQLAAERPVVWKKLDEEDPRAGVPRKSFTTIYKAVSAPANLRRFLSAADFYLANREGIQALAGHGAVGPVVDLLRTEEPWIEKRRLDALKRLVAYRWFSFLRRNRSAWKKAMFGLFEASGRAVAELRQPGVKPRGAPKRVTADLSEEILGMLRPGDVFVTRHDDALSNLFLPGFWPHAALFLGNRNDLADLGCKLDGEGPWFLEAKKDGVRIRHAKETLAVDAFVVLRPPLEGAALAEGLRRALTHEGKDYDFLFDFRTADRLACTEVVYRGFHGCGGVRFQLREVGGRLCLPAEEMVDQAVACGFRILAVAGLAGGRLLTESAAEVAFYKNRGVV